LRNYGAALIDFTADRFVVLPYKGDPGDTTATVRTEVKRSSGDKVPVNFSLRKTPEGWKAWDVVIEGISYVKKSLVKANFQQPLFFALAVSPIWLLMDSLMSGKSFTKACTKTSLLNIRWHGSRVPKLTSELLGLVSRSIQTER